nr:AraC family transcriptional regulator [Roseicella aerolata]
MVAACIVPSPETRDAAAPLLEHARLERARQAIRQNLRSPTLTPKRLCRLIGMSRSQIYRLFEPMGGVARYIQAERLREAHCALADADNTRDIHEIAEDLGFFDASAFSRTFRRRYGCKPSEVRAAALSGSGDIPLRQSPAQAPADTLTAVLRTLR